MKNFVKMGFALAIACVVSSSLSAAQNTNIQVTNTLGSPVTVKYIQQGRQQSNMVQNNATLSLPVGSYGLTYTYANNNAAVPAANVISTNAGAHVTLGNSAAAAAVQAAAAAAAQIAEQANIGAPANPAGCANQNPG